jgi:ATP-dependent DNA helicase RecQ
VTRIETSEGAPADELLSEQNIRRVLQKSFGFQELRPGQLDVMQDLLAGRQVISVMPTGAGKSLCYQLRSPRSSPS